MNKKSKTYSSRKGIKTKVSGDQLMKVIPIGKKNAIKSDALISLLGVSGKRELGYAVANVRAHGGVILSDTVNGYYLPADKWHRSFPRRQIVSLCCQTVSSTTF